jgi:DNA-binding response OmpR family regulator
VRILVVEDEETLAGHLARALRQDGHDPRLAHDGRVALAEAQAGDFDLIVLDVELPRMNGLEVLKQLRESGVPSRILMLTARGESPDKAAGLTSGANDYLTKPFAMNELLARVNALGTPLAEPAGQTLRVGDLTLKLNDHEAWRGDRRIELSERECALLQVLMREPGRVFSRVELSERVWTREHEHDTTLVDVFIGRLRAKIDEGASEPLINAVRHQGYSMQADTSR